VDLIPYQGMELQVGDRVMVVGSEKAIAQVADLLGNSMKKLREPNLVTIFVGIALGVLLGSIPLLNVPQPVKLGLAGGPLIVAILIGRFGTHFHLVTYTTMSANLMLREVGITLFLAAAGIGAGARVPPSVWGGTSTSPSRSATSEAPTDRSDTAKMPSSATVLSRRVHIAVSSVSTKSPA